MPDDFTASMSAAEKSVTAAPLALKLARIMQEIGELGIQPDKRNRHFDYPYYTDKLVFETCRPRLAKMGIIVIPNVLSIDVRAGETAKHASTWLTTLHVEFTVYDGNTGTMMTGSGVGQGDDQGDKGANKAMTGAFKFFLLKLFQIGGEADAESDDSTDKRSEERSRDNRDDTRQNDDRPARRSSGNRGGRGDDQDGRPRDGRDEDRARDDRDGSRRDGDRDRGRDREDSRDGGRRDEVQIGDSNIEGIKRGGRANYATDAQLREVRQLARDLEWKPADVAGEMARLNLDEVELSDDPAEAGPQLVKALEALRSTEIGELIQSMTRLFERDAQGGGYGN